MSLTLTRIRLFAVISSLLLSLFMVLTDDIINSDGILYINTAQAYLNGGLTAALQLFDWPFFAILIAYVHKLTSLSLEHSALLLNGLLFALFIDTFIRICHKILPNLRQLLIAAILILCFSILNEYRDFIIRDIGYWAFCSLTLYRFIAFIEKPTLANGIFWQGVAGIAVLFRIEGGVILILLPFHLFLLFPFKQAIQQYLKLNYFLFIGVIIASITLSFQMGDRSGALSANLALLNFEDYVITLNRHKEILETQILSPFSADYSSLILISGLIVMLFYKLAKGLSLVYLGLFVASWWHKKPAINSPFSGLIIYFLLINLSVLIAFLLSRYFISTRYCMMALISLLLLMLPRICTLIEHLWLTRNKVLLSFIGLLLFVGLADSVTSTRSKAYIKETAIWARENLPDNSRVLSDNKFIEYYFTSHTGNNTITKGDIGTYLNYDYLILVEKRKNKNLRQKLAAMEIEPIFELTNKRSGKAVVYKITP